MLLVKSYPRPNRRNINPISEQKCWSTTCGVSKSAWFNWAAELIHNNVVRNVTWSLLVRLRTLHHVPLYRVVSKAGQPVHSKTQQHCCAPRGHKKFPSVFRKHGVVRHRCCVRGEANQDFSHDTSAMFLSRRLETLLMLYVYENSRGLHPQATSGTAEWVEQRGAEPAMTEPTAGQWPLRGNQGDTDLQNGGRGTVFEINRNAVEFPGQYYSCTWKSFPEPHIILCTLNGAWGVQVNVYFCGQFIGVTSRTSWSRQADFFPAFWPNFVHHRILLKMIDHSLK